MGKLALMIHIDALRYDYVTEDDMPFLYSLGLKGLHKDLIPPFGFKPDKVYLTGTQPEISQGGTHFIFDETRKGLPFSWLIPGWFDCLNIYVQYPFRLLVQKLISLKAETKRIRANPFIGQIPFSLMKWFTFGETKYVYEEGFIPYGRTIYDYLRDQGIGFFYHGPPEFNASATYVRNHVLNKRNWDVPFAFLLIADLDSCGHRFGPNSPERHKVSKAVDDALRDIYEYLSKYYDQTDLIAFGDHGMVQIEDTIDFQPFLKKLPLKIGKDYIYFLDSTFARFWYFNSMAKETLTYMLSKVSGGDVISDEHKKKYSINYQNRKFGDIIYWVDAGKMIFPNFWHVRRPKKGMHGYRFEVKDNHASLIVYSSAKQDPINYKGDILEMVDVFRLVMNSLEIKAN